MPIISAATATAAAANHGYRPGILQRLTDNPSFQRFVTALYSNQPSTGKRPMSNLLDNKGYPLSQADYNGIVALFRMKESAWRNTQMWASIFSEIYAPDLTQARDIRTVAKEHRKWISEISKSFSALGSAKWAAAHKTDKGGRATFLVYANTGLALSRSFPAVVDGPTFARYYQADSSRFNTDLQTITKKTSDLAYASLPPNVRAIFKALNGTFRTQIILGRMALFLDVPISKTQMEHICNNRFDDVRTVDLYGLVRTWAQGRTDTSVTLPSSTKPIADIAATLPPGGTPRLSEDGILVDSAGDLFYLPATVDNVSRYDTALAITLTGPGGVISQVHENEEAARKLPGGQNVFLDWVNYKWAYVNSSGNLEVTDLSRAQAGTPTHTVEFLNTLVAAERGVSFISHVAQFASRELGSFPPIRDFALQGSRLIGNHPDYEGTELSDFKIYNLAILADMADSTNYPGPFKDPKVTSDSFKPYKIFSEYVGKLAAAITKDPDPFYRDYGVKTMATVAAETILFSKYANQYDKVVQADRDRRAPYLEAPLDKSWKPVDLPYLADKRGWLPHQANVANALRNSPDNAILHVRAGGGKTPIIVTDILKEMKQGVKGPFLVMCPSHLVAQYVIEFSYFTESRINTIPVTSYTANKRRGGLEALQKMLDVAPINTVVIADYNLAKGSKTVNVGYGTSATQVYSIVEFLRQYRFAYVALDESHQLKNINSVQARAVGALVADIPKKRLASGTFLSNSPEDIAGQFALLDPSVFGTVEKFQARYSASGTSGRINKMAPGAELAILRKLRENSRYVQVNRKEWAAILPKSIENVHLVSLSAAQRVLYESILQTSVEELQREAAKNPKLAALLGLVNLSEEEREAAMDEMDEGEDKHSDLSGGLDELLRPFLARLEQFMCAPASDPLGSTLQGTDRVSPKVAEFARICREHIAQGIPGKILAFTNQTASAVEIYNNLPADLKAVTLLYTAGQKTAVGAEFENNDKMQIMIGVGQSMETGLNLQFCSRLIRAETVMSPGALEQGNSRIGRPNVKASESRDAIYYDWILVDHSIDVTKIAYLLTKKVRIAAVEEADNPVYAGMEVPQLFKLTLDNILENNTQDTLAPYLGPEGIYREYSKRLTEDYKVFRDANKHLLDDAGRLKMVPLARSENLAGSKIMRRVPYVPGAGLYKAKELGLVRLDEHLRTELSADDEDDDSDAGAPEVVLPSGNPIEDAKKQRQADFLSRVVGLQVHTERGDGEIIGGSARVGLVRVRLKSGERFPFSALSVFVITKPQTSGKDIRLSLAKISGDIPIDTPSDVKDVKVLLPTKNEIDTAQKRASSKSQELSLSLIVSNDLLGLELDNPKDNVLAAKTLKLAKFVEATPYVYAEIKNPQVLLRFMQKVSAAGYHSSPTLQSNIRAFYVQWSKMRKNAISFFGQATAANLKNFYNILHKPNPDPKLFLAYMLVENETVYLAMPISGHKGNLNVMNKIRVPGVRFYKAAPQLVRFFPNASSMIQFLASLSKAGVTIANDQELAAGIKHMRRLIPKVTKMTSEEFFQLKNP